MALGGADNLARSPELRTKLLWTLGLLCAYRIGVHIPVPGVDGGALAHFFESVAGTLFGLFDMFSGGGLRNVSVFALGIMPYISASIILQLLQVVSPELKRMAKEEGAAGRRKITQYTRYSTVLITIIQGFGIAVGLETMYSPGGVPVVLEPGWTFRIMTMLTLTAGTVLIMWLGEQITEKGIGNGISLIIFSGIVVGIPGALVKSFQLIKLGDMSLFIALALVILMVAVLIGVVFMERAQRRIPIQYALTYPKRVPGVVPELDFAALKVLTFDVADDETFRCLAACKKAIRKGGLGPCAANGANEEAVRLFLEDKIGFLDIGRLVEAVVDSDSFGGDYTLSDVYECDRMAREFVRVHL